MSRYINSQQATNKAFKNLDFSDVGTIKEIIFLSRELTKEKTTNPEKSRFFGVFFIFIHKKIFCEILQNSVRSQHTGNTQPTIQVE